MTLLSSHEYYDALAPSFAALADARRRYLDAIDALVVQDAQSARPTSHLDVGCGDGRRTLRISTELGIRSVLGIDESSGMLVLASRRGLSVHHGTVRDEVGGPYDLVTCLWNTLGHVAAADRVPVLARISELLVPGGVLFLDVNNRYNARAYGVRRVAENIWRDLIGAPCGDVVASALSAAGPIATEGHVFAPGEVDRLLGGIPRLTVRRTTYVDYVTGRVVPSRFQGQILYGIKRTG